MVKSRFFFFLPINIANSDVKPSRATEIMGTLRNRSRIGRGVPNPACGCVLFGLLTVWPTENWKKRKKAVSCQTLKIERFQIKIQTSRFSRKIMRLSRPGLIFPLDNSGLAPESCPACPRWAEFCGSQSPPLRGDRPAPSLDLKVGTRAEVNASVKVAFAGEARCLWSRSHVPGSPSEPMGLSHVFLAHTLPRHSHVSWCQFRLPEAWSH